MTITIELFKGLKKIVSIGILVDSPTRRVGKSFFDYEYLREFEAQIGTTRNVVWGTYAEPIFAKTQKNLPRCHVPLKERFSYRGLTPLTYTKVCPGSQKKSFVFIYAYMPSTFPVWFDCLRRVA